MNTNEWTITEFDEFHILKLTSEEGQEEIWLTEAELESLKLLLNTRTK
jgi:hypothetical protein